jgi:tRNA modification GTPase
MMYDLTDTIVAVSSPSGGVRSVIRITGPQTLPTCEGIFEPTPALQIRNLQSTIRHSCILSGSVRVSDELTTAAWLYLFFAPHSYTGDDLAEIHIHASRIIVEALVQRLLARGLRLAGPGEFTARAYLNGKLDLAQAEAVNEIISSSNRLQLEAAEKLLGGRLTKAADEIREALLDCLSRIEAGLDFSGDDIEFISAQAAAERLATIQKSLEALLAGSIRCETLIDLPAVGIAGAPNAGKSSLLNALLGWERSIVSPQPKTTRDVLSGLLTTARFQCVLFDCAGLVVQPDNTLDELAQRAAIEALHRCSAVLFCVDSTKPDMGEDTVIRALIKPKNVIYIATKSDLLSSKELSRKMEELKRAFQAEFLATSAKTGSGFQRLLDCCASAVAESGSELRPQSKISNMSLRAQRGNLKSEMSIVALTARHRQAVTEATEGIRHAIVEVNRGNEDVAVMMIRAACQAISQIEQQSLDEQVLDRIFSRFCIGK